MTPMTRILAPAARTALAAIALNAMGAAWTPLLAAPTDLNDIPMAVSNQVKANFLMLLDNSQSMDALMAGALQSGDNALTRGNIGREVLRSVLGDYRSTFKWGLMSFATATPTLNYTHVYYVGNATTMVFTDDCTNGVSASNAGRRCIAVPDGQRFTGGNFVTYDASSDDPEILDALYDSTVHPSIWGISPAGATSGTTNYDLWFKHVPGRGSSWALSEFADHWGMGVFTPTDAGYTPAYPNVTRQLMLPRGWGYWAAITGGGKLWEAVAGDSDAHYAQLRSRLGSETNASTSEIKNGALYTPIAGALDSVRNYFSGSADWRSGASNRSPIDAYCQKNFVMLLTDGLPTGNRDGALYSDAQRSDSCSAWSSDGTSCTGSWTFGQAANDAFDAVTALRNVSYSGCSNCSTFDVQTYVIAMGDTVSNARAVALMNKMAEKGGTTSAFFASDATSLKNAVTESVNNAVARTGAAAAVAVANANITATTAAYQSSYESGTWTGDLKSYRLDVATGIPTTQNWSAQSLLDPRGAESRKIASYSGVSGSGQGIVFRSAADGAVPPHLSTVQQTTLAASVGGSTADGAGIVSYLRGDRSGETATSDSAQKYRRRTHLLGDIVNSEPVLLGAPSAAYTDTVDPGYSAFKTANATRQSLVFQGANDGMLHAFNADSGAEVWAYVPSLILPTLAKLSLVRGFSHHYYVDGTPSVGDVDFSRTAGSASGASPDWRTLLVGGLGKGGYGYYALDVTSASASDEATVAGKVLWEFPNDATAGQVVANLGYSFGRPIITKTADQGWVVLVTSGYNNVSTVSVGGASYTGDGVGHLYVLNARTGAVLRDIPTGVGSVTTPSGLAPFSAYIDNVAANNTVTQAYAGDLLGNVWRFDLTGVASSWSVKRLATLVDGSGNAQPVTTAPELASIYESNASYRFVYVGTGKYLGDSDVTTTATQTMYGLVDDLTATPTIEPLRSNLQQQTLGAPVTDPQTGTITRQASSNTVVLAGSGKKRGWYIDLSVAGERVNTDPQLALGSLVFTSNIPSSTLCVPGGSSYLNIIDYRSGGALDSSVLGWASKYLGNALASRPVLVQLPSGELRALIRLSSDRTIAESVPSPLVAQRVKRISWRELPDKSK